MFKENNWLRTDHLVGSELSVFEVGFEDVMPRSPYKYEQLDYWLIHYVVAGEGLFFINDEVHQLTAGDGFVIPPFTDNNYYPLVGNPWSYRWIGVRGSGAEAAFSAAGINSRNHIYHHPDIKPLASLFAKTYEYFEADHFYGALGSFYEIISTLQRDFEERSRLETTADQRLVYHAVDYIKAHYADADLRINEVAEAVQIERTYLYKLFMKNLAIAPKDYLMQYRMNQATHLLRHSELSIAAIATRCGFGSYSQFSRAFSKLRHVSPSAFRKRFTNAITPINTGWN